MTSKITIQVADDGGVDTNWMFPGLSAARPISLSTTNTSAVEIEYELGGATFVLAAHGTAMGQAIGLDAKGRVTTLSLSDGENLLIDVQFALDSDVLSEYGGCAVNSFLSLTPDALANAISGKSEVEFEFLGGAGNDRIYGSGYFDFLDGKAGRDRLTGNGAGDTFYLGFFGKADRDLIVDFDRAEDNLAIDGNVLAGVLPSNLARSFRDITGTGVATEDANDRLLYNRNSGKLFYDPDGNKEHGERPEIVAVFDNHARIEADDFQVFL